MSLMACSHRALALAAQLQWNQLSTMVLFRQRFSGSISSAADTKSEMGSVPILKNQICGYEYFVSCFVDNFCTLLNHLQIN